MSRWNSLILLAAALAAPAIPAPTRLPPIEQCSPDAGFGAFRQALEGGVASRDMAALTALMSDDVRVSFGGRFGKAQFAAYWSGAQARHGELWRQMEAILKLGCATARDGSGVEYRAWPAMFVTSDGLDGFTAWVALPGAQLRARPAAGSRRMMRLPAWTVLEEFESNGGPWVGVRTPRGRRGYVAAAEVRSIIDYRLIAERRGGAWRITAFVAGD